MGNTKNQVLLISFLTGVAGTGLGGLCAVLFPWIGEKALARMLGATAGLMLAIVCFELLPEAMTLSVPMGALGTFAGVMGMALLGPLMKDENDTARVGKLMGAGIALHNLPEGLAVGAGLAGAPVMGLKLALSIALHDVPEGVAMALPLRVGGRGRGRVFLSTLLAGLPTVVGAMIGVWVGGVSPDALSFCLALAGGAMLQITCRQLIPQSGNTESGLWLMIGLLAGGGVCFFLQ